MEDFDLKKYLAESKLLKEEIMIDTTVMVDPNNTLMSNASDEEIDYVKANLTNVPKMSVEDFQEKYDEYFDRFYSEGDPLDLQIKALQIHIDKGVLTREEAIEALAMLQGQDVEEFEDMFLAENKLLKENTNPIWVIDSFEDNADISDAGSEYKTAVINIIKAKHPNISSEDLKKSIEVTNDFWYDEARENSKGSDPEEIEVSAEDFAGSAIEYYEDIIMYDKMNPSKKIKNTLSPYRADDFEKIKSLLPDNVDIDQNKLEQLYDKYLDEFDIDRLIYFKGFMDQYAKDFTSPKK